MLVNDINLAGHAVIVASCCAGEGSLQRGRHGSGMRNSSPVVWNSMNCVPMQAQSGSGFLRGIQRLHCMPRRSYFDREAVFVDSFNLDPRSGSINTEA
jgi:hypothetical protein